GNGGRNGIGIDLATTSNIKTFTNSGAIIGNNKAGMLLASGSTIQNFNNSGSIQGLELGIQTSGTINTFTNDGLIKSTGSGDYSHGIWVNSSSNIQTFTNNGTIIGSTRGVYFETSSQTNTFINKGTIQGAQAIVLKPGISIEKLTNTGTIKSTGNVNPGAFPKLSAGILLRQNASVKTFTNEGLISANYLGIVLGQATIDNFTNKGTIEVTKTHGIGGAVSLLSVYGASSYIKTFTNEGVLKSNSQGIVAETGNKIDTIINKGTIDASSNGLTFYTYNDGSSGNKVELGSIILEKGSSIKAGNNGINLDGTSNKPITVSGSIEVKDKASVSGNNAGIVIGSGKKVNAQIKISGSVTGGAAGIVNEGTIGSSSSEDGNTGGIVVSGGSISSSNEEGSGIVNRGNGSIAGDIKVESGASIKGGITNTGSGSITGNIVVEENSKLDSITNTSTS
ncbi:autotransporter outer membrane beta-barrel domain-containing protein, partial [Campylobacter jejuni]|nr:autotransporter outer membrane beta-barrel domain-containing protein [Campylobacter jejuni]